MSKRPAIESNHNYSRLSVTTSDGRTFAIDRDEDGDYSVTDVGSEVTLYISNSAIASSIANGILEIIEMNDNE